MTTGNQSWLNTTGFQLHLRTTDKSEQQASSALINPTSLHVHLEIDVHNARPLIEVYYDANIRRCHFTVHCFPGAGKDSALVPVAGADLQPLQ